MTQTDIGHLLAAVLAISVIAVVGLWSWNTLAELFGAPEARLRHAVAALALLTALRLVMRRRGAAVSCRYRS